MSIESANAGFILKQGRVILRAIVCAFLTNDLLLHFMYDREKANIATAFRVTSKCWIALPGNIHGVTVKLLANISRGRRPCIRYCTLFSTPLPIAQTSLANNLLRLASNRCAKIGRPPAATPRSISGEIKNRIDRFSAVRTFCLFVLERTFV